MYSTKQRSLILSTLSTHGYHPTADELRAEIVRQGHEISTATVYRNLRQLCDSGSIMRIQIPDASDRYDAVNDGHYHLICERCGSVSDVPREAMPDFAVCVREKCGCEVNSASVLLYGVCAQCKRP
ncbi:MAG: transcriptional repressor [Clostridia bacterium]|nr:transcriptional repressor [Clostridia bacterium]